MAAKPDSPIFTNDEKILLRLTCIHKRVTTDVLRFAFENDTKDRPQHMPLVEYYKSKGITGFNRGLNKEQKKHINNDPTGGTFDITLFYTCLRNGSCCLADKNDDKWTVKDGNSIESLIGIVKDKRNNLAHEQLSFTNKQLLDEAQDIKDTLVKIIKCCGQLYNLPDSVTDTKIDEVGISIKKYLFEDFDPKTIEEYKKELIFEALAEAINSEGVKNLQEQYDKHCEDKVSTVNHLVDISLPLDNIYTEMRLKGESVSGKVENTLYEEVLLNPSQAQTEDIVVISGVAGVGKTTFTKKMVCDWKCGLSDMKYLIDHNILLKTECRNTVLNCFDDLLLSLMPRLSRDFRLNDLRKVILAQNVLVMVDGLDELNKNSADLFEEILYLKKSHRISLLITTRPEKLTYLKDKIRSHQLDMKHIELFGVPADKRAELVTKYYHEIVKMEKEKNNEIQNVSGLLAYLEKTMYRLADLWKLPYNLTLITLLWAYDYMKVDTINTPPELYREIVKLCMTKVIERLRSSKETHHLPKRKLWRNVQIFLKHLAKESLIALKDDHINLAQHAYERLEDVCTYINIHIEELISAFIKRLPGVEDLYTYHHKGLQDYLAALYIWMKITKKGERIETLKIIETFTTVLDQNEIDFEVAQNILRFTKRELESHSHTARFVSRVRNLFNLHRKSSVIGSIMEEIHGSNKYDVSKFQNMFICLIGLFYLENDVIHDQTKLEALKLLQMSGVQNNEHWITVLSSVKCDDYVASFISKQPGILDGYIRITDSSASAYVALMQALKPPLENAHTVEVDIDIKGDLEYSDRKLFQLINSHQFIVRTLLVSDDNYKVYLEMLEELTIPFVDAGNVEGEIIVEDLLVGIQIVKLIERKGITVVILKAQDFDMNDSNFHDVINSITCLPSSPLFANLTVINIDLRHSYDNEKLRNLILSKHLKVRMLFVNESNYEVYTEILKEVEVSLTDIHNIEIGLVVDIDKPITDLTIFLKEIKGKNLTIKKFKLRDVHLTDKNAAKFWNALNMMSQQWQKVNTTAVQFDEYYNSFMDMDLLIELGFKMKTISIRDENLRLWITVFENLKTPLTDLQLGDVDIDVNLGLLKIHKLLLNINDKKFRIVNLKFDNRPTEINDDNAHRYVKTLQLLPISVIKKSTAILKFAKESSVIGAVLNEISKQQFKLSLNLDFGFYDLVPYSHTTVNALKKVFKWCYVREYVGLIFKEMSIPLTLLELSAGIPDTDAYLSLKAFLDNPWIQQHRLELQINISPTINKDVIVPLPDLFMEMKLWLHKITTDTEIYTASEIAKRLAPTSGYWKGKFSILGSYNSKFEPSKIRKLLECLRGLSVSSLSFPESCRPNRSDEASQIQNLAKEVLNCRSIKWE